VPGWLIVTLLVALLVACAGCLAWFLPKVFATVLYRRELRSLELGVLERLAAPGADEARLSELLRLHDIVDRRLRRRGRRAPPLKSSLERAMHRRATMPGRVRQPGGGRLASVATITRLIDRLENDPTHNPPRGEASAAAKRSEARSATNSRHSGAFGASSHPDSYSGLTSDQRTQIGATFLSLAGLFVVSTIIAIASHAFKLSSAAAIGLFGASAALLLLAVWAFGRLGGKAVAMCGMILLAIALATSLIVVRPSQGRRSRQRAPLSGPYFIGGTCADEVCKLRQHVEPDISSSFGGAPLLPDGSEVYIRCQAVGGVFRLHHGGRKSNESNVWDLLGDGRYVSDMFVNTSKHGELDASIPQCSQ
jgi:hypothetical protein